MTTASYTNENGESTPLISNSPAPQPYYFLSGTNRESIDEGSINRLPAGSVQEEFASRPVMSHRNGGGSTAHQRSQNPGFFSRLFFGTSHPQRRHTSTATTTQRNNHTGGGGGGATKSQILKTNKAAIKIEPKAFFANERTFLAWLHTSVLLAGASIAITSFSEGDLLKQLYGIVLLPVAIAFLCYAMHQYGRRAKMIRATAPGPYEDILGPSVLAVVLIISIVAQFSIKLYSVLQ